MAIDFEALITKHAGEDGNIPAANIAKIVSAISSAVGREFVPKDRYNAKLDEITQLEQDKAAAEDSATKAGKFEERYNKEHEGTTVRGVNRPEAPRDDHARNLVRRLEAGQGRQT